MYTPKHTYIFIDIVNYLLIVGIVTSQKSHDHKTHQSRDQSSNHLKSV